MSEPTRTDTLSADSSDYITGASSDTVNATEGGTTRDGGVAVFGPTGATTETTDTGQ